MPFEIFITDIVAGLLGVITFYSYLRSQLYPARNLPLPPGPRKRPIIENALDIPSKFPAEAFQELGKEYNSDIIHLSAFGTNIIVLNSYEMAQEMLDKRSAIYSSRPMSVMLSELGGYDYPFVVLPYNSLWRLHRRIFTKYFHPSNTEIHQPRETEHVHVLLGKLFESPERFLSHIRHMVGATALSMVYGVRIKPEDDPYIQLAEHALETIDELITPGRFLVDTFPLLKNIPEWVPGTTFHKVAKKARKESKEVVDVPYNASMAAIKDGTILPSFIYEGLLDLQSKRNIDQSQNVQTLKEIGMMTYLGAMDTSYAAISTFVLAMLIFPEAQKSAQQELDKVLGGRLPDHNDLNSIPYMTALLWEVLRWETPLLTGFAHSNSEEDVFKGYYIPKGSVILPNHRAMLYNEHDYPDPETFKPERFLKDGKLNDSVKNPEDIVFGFGRRKCPGRHIAKSSTLLAMASILSMFNIEKPVDKDGNIVEPQYEFNHAGVNHVYPFTCRIEPRSEKAVSIIRSLSD